MPGSSRFTAIATLGSPLESFCRELGVDLDPLARSLGLDVSVFQKESARINLEAFTELLHRICEATDNDSLGIRYGSFYSLGDSGTFDFALLNCGRLREALEFYSHYQPLLADYVFFNIEIGQQFSSIEWRNSGIVTHSSTYVDFRAVLKVKMLRRYLGQNYVPSRVDLVRSPPRSNIEHKRTLGPNLHFNALMNKISFPSSLLDSVSDHSDKRLFKLLKASCDEQLARLRRLKDIPFQSQRENRCHFAKRSEHPSLDG